MVYIPTTSSWAFKPNGIARCMTCKYICHCSNTRSSLTRRTYGIIENIDCSSANILNAYQCPLCDKQYLRDTGSRLRAKSKCRRHAIKRKNPLSAFSHQVRMRNQIRRPCVLVFSFRWNYFLAQVLINKVIIADLTDLHRSFFSVHLRF